MEGILFGDLYIKWRLNALRENKKNTFELGGFIPLLQGEETEKTLRNDPELFDSEKVKISFMCGINSENLLEVFLQFSTESGSGQIDMDPVQQNRIDPLHMYRLMKLINRLSALEIGQILYIMNLPIEWEIYREGDKKKISKEIGLKKSEVKKIMEEVPFNLDEIIWTFKQHGIAIDTFLTQKAALKGQIKISPFFKDLGIRTAEEITEEEKKKTEIMEKYKKYLNAYFAEESQYRISDKSIMDSLFENFVFEAMKLGAKDDSLIVGYALYSIEKWRIDSITDIVNIQAQGIDPAIISMVESNYRIKFYKKVISFLKKTFSKEIPGEEYIASIVNLKKMQNLNG